MQIRRNKDGQQSIRDLRSALSETRITVYWQGGNWMISDAYGITTPCPYWLTERQAIQKALFGEAESKEEARYAAKH